MRAARKELVRRRCRTRLEAWVEEWRLIGAWHLQCAQLELFRADRLTPR